MKTIVKVNIHGAVKYINTLMPFKPKIIPNTNSNPKYKKLLLLIYLNKKPNIIN